ncbi:MAG: diguanylate cyclase, partial [Thermoleophilaceae bacterium]
MLPGADLRSTTEVAERLREAVAEGTHGGLGISISFGGVASSDGGRIDFDRIYREADSALYEAKQAGRNTV